jgi:thiol-disulfide isomerase/thioredoxin
MEIINSDKVNWPELFLKYEFIVVNYQPDLECPGCYETNQVFIELSKKQEFEEVKFLWVDSRNNPIAEQFIKKTQSAFIAVFKDGFLVECNNVTGEQDLRDMLNRLLVFKIKL